MNQAIKFTFSLLFLIGSFDVMCFFLTTTSPVLCLLLSRMVKISGETSGVEEFTFPGPRHLLLHRDILLNYLTNLNKVQVELARILQKIAINNTVIVSTVNKGQAELLINFVCSSRSRGLDFSNLIVFPTDLYSKVLAESLGLATFYSEEVNSCFPLPI